LKFHIEREQYPRNVGQRLVQVLVSIPSGLRRVKLRFPLVPLEQCFRVSQYAAETDHSDVLLLLEANCGKHLRPPSVDSPIPKSVACQDKTLGEIVADLLLEELSPDNITRTVSFPIDEAFNQFKLSSVVAESLEDFLDMALALYCQLSGAGGAFLACPNSDGALAEAVALTERAFSRYGGIDAAVKEATHPTRLGAMRFVADRVKDQYEAEAVEKFIGMKIKLAGDPLDAIGKAAFIKVLQKRLAPFLPADVREQPPEAFATRFEEIARAYARSMDEVRHILARS